MENLKRVARAALVTLAFAVTLPAAAQTCKSSFDLATDMLADNQLCGTPQWELLRSEGPLVACPKGTECTQGALTPLPNFRTDLANVPGFMGFHGSESCNVHACFPFVLVNTTDAAQVINPPTSYVSVPAGRVLLHPANPDATANGNAAVGFRSPFTGLARVTIALERADAGLVQWQVALGKQILLPLEPVAYPSTATFAQDVSLAKGDLLTVRVDAAGNYGCDSSLLSFTVERL